MRPSRVPPRVDDLALRPTVTHRHHVLGAGLEPTHRSAHAARQLAEHEQLGRRTGLGPEAAADVGADDPHVGLVEPVDLGDRVADGVGALAALVLHQSVALPPGRARATLDRAGRQALVDHLLGDDDLGGREVDRLAAVVERPHHVGAGLVEQDGLVGLRGERIDQGRERVVVDEHGLGRVGSLLASLGDDGGDRLTDEAHDVARQQRTLHRRVEHRHGRTEVVETEVGRGDHGQHAGHRHGLARRRSRRGGRGPWSSARR